MPRLMVSLYQKKQEIQSCKLGFAIPFVVERMGML
jgi:hypothetical protein